MSAPDLDEPAPLPSRDIDDLLVIMARLRHPDDGCAWDLAQTFASIAPYTIEEAYEVVEAIARGDLDDLRDELGDLLLQVVFHARIAEERGAFAFGDVVQAITAKLIRRHPHVFGHAGRLSAEAVKAVWDEVKAQEKSSRAHRRGDAASSVLDDIPAGLPATMRALRLQKRLANVGFDWPDAAPVLAKIREEVGEAEEALHSGDRLALQDEIGDVLFAVVNLARHAGVDPDVALAGTNAKVERRFRQVESGLRQQGRSPADATLDDMERLWAAAKATEKSQP